MPFLSFINEAKRAADAVVSDLQGGVQEVSGDIQKFFEPTDKVRIRDVAREAGNLAKSFIEPTPLDVRERIKKEGGFIEKGLVGIEEAGEATIGVPFVGAGLGILGKGRKVIKPLGKITQDPIQKITQAIKQSIPLRRGQEALYAEERARRTARIVAVGEKIPGEKGFFAQLGQLKGPLPKRQFEVIRKQFSQEEVDFLFDKVQQTKTLLPFEQITTKGALANLFEGTVPTRNEISLLSEVFPKDFIDTILQKRPASEKFFEMFGKAFNLPRAIQTTIDLSSPLRQGIFLMGRPKQFLPAFKDMFKFAASEKAYQGLIDSIKVRPTYRKMKGSRLALTDLGTSLTNREEAFMSNWAEKIPGFGVLARASNRAYTGFLNKLRADTFDDILKNTQRTGRILTEKELSDIATFINSATGRGNLPAILERISPVLNSVFFSPRLMASRLNLLNPLFYATLSPIARKEALKSLFSFTAIAGTVLTLADLTPGIEVGKNPKSADFGKIKVGNTRYDILGGFQQYFRFTGQFISGEIVSTTTGRTITLGEGFKPLTREQIVLRFFEQKTSPIASFIIALLQGQTATGEDVDVPAETINRFIPMVVQDLYDISQEKGAEGILYGLPAVFGVGVQTYGKQELVSGESQIGEPTAQIRPIPELAEKIRELVLGQLPLGTSKGFSVEAYYDQLSNLPREEAADVFDRIAEENPELAKKLLNVVKERERGITVQDKDLKAKGVASGDRALTIKKQLDALKTSEEKADLWDQYVQKGIITKEVARQLQLIQ